MKTDTLRTVDQVAAHLRVHRKQVLKAIHIGELRAINVGLGSTKVWRVREQDLERFEQSRIT